MTIDRKALERRAESWSPHDPCAPEVARELLDARDRIRTLTSFQVKARRWACIVAFVWPVICYVIARLIGVVE